MSAAIERELAGLLQEWGEAIVAKDPVRIGRFATDDQVPVRPGAGAIEKERFLQAVRRGGGLRHDCFETDVTRVRACGDAANVTAHVRNTGACRGQTFASDEWTTGVYLKLRRSRTCVQTAFTPRRGAS